MQIGFGEIANTRRVYYAVYLLPEVCYLPEGSAWMDKLDIEYTFHDIKSDNLSVAELRKWHTMSILPLKYFLNTNGLQYKALNLASKRPIPIGDGFVLVGFKQDEWELSYIVNIQEGDLSYLLEIGRIIRKSN